jgi:hypothetical protein
VPSSTSRKSSRPEDGIRLADILLYEKVVGQMNTLRAEFTVLSKTKPDNSLNQLKIAIVNERLKDANRLLVGEHKPFATFEEFNSDRMPSNSDVLLVLSDYLAALARWRAAHIYQDVLHHLHWRTLDGDVEVDPAKR